MRASLAGFGIIVQKFIAEGAFVDAADLVIIETL